jgi:DNA-directed RNA polymerase specialized sigma24 family protein
MTRTQDGDANAYAILLHEITPYLRRVIGRGWLDRCGDIESAVRDVLMTLHVVRHTYDASRPFEPWLLDIATCRIRLLQRRCMRDGTFKRRDQISSAAASLLKGVRNVIPRTVNSRDMFRRLIRVAAGSD